MDSQVIATHTASGKAWIRWAAAGICGTGAAFCLALNMPGHLSDDSVIQLVEARDKLYGANGHPPVMSWLMGVGDSLWRGAGVLVLLDVALIFGALAALTLIGKRASWRAALLAAALIPFPQLLIYPAIVWKDVLFAGASTAAFAALAWAAAMWDRPGWRWPLAAAGLMLVVLATMTRQNGAVVLPFAALAVGWSAKRGGGAMRGGAWTLGFLIAGVLAAAVGSAALTPPRTSLATVRGSMVGIQLYDLVRALVLAPETPLDTLHSRAPWLEHDLRTEGVAVYTPVRIDTLEPLVERESARAPIDTLIIDQWRSLFAHDPWLYLRVRAEAFKWVFLTPSKADCVLIYTGVDGPAEEMAEAGLSYRKSARDDTLARYALRFAGTPVYSHAAYAAVGVALMVWLLRRRRPADIPVAAMLASAFAFAAAFAIISIACDYRYLYDVDLAAIAAGLYAVATWSAPPGQHCGAAALGAAQMRVNMQA